MNLDANSCEHKENQSEILQCLNTGSTACKLKVLDKLFRVQIVDTKDTFWRGLSDGLRTCFVSHNNEVFTRTLKIHHKIIYSLNTAFDGYLSLLRGASALLNASNSQPSHLEQTLKLALATQRPIVQMLLHNTNSKMTEEIIEQFIFMITLGFDRIEKLDPYANWLKFFCYGANIRQQLFSHLKAHHEKFLAKIIHATNLSRGHYSFLCYFLKFNSISNSEQCIEKIILGINSENCQLVSDLFSENLNLLTFKLLDLLLEQSNQVCNYRFLVTPIKIFFNRG